MGSQSNGSAPAHTTGLRRRAGKGGENNMGVWALLICLGMPALLATIGAMVLVVRLQRHES